jgi:hypothetical protein
MPHQGNQSVTGQVLGRIRPEEGLTPKMPTVIVIRKADIQPRPWSAARKIAAQCHSMILLVRTARRQDFRNYSL